MFFDDGERCWVLIRNLYSSLDAPCSCASTDTHHMLRHSYGHIVMGVFMVFQGCWTALKMDKDDPYLIRRGSILRVHRYPPHAKASIWEDSGNSQILFRQWWRILRSNVCVFFDKKMVPHGPHPTIQVKTIYDVAQSHSSDFLLRPFLFFSHIFCSSNISKNSSY